MNINRTILSIFALTAMLICGTAGNALAADVNARLSSRETYVGMPVTLQISIDNATDYEQPTIPDIDGCDVRSAGAPSQSSQITIINGRRSERRSVIIQYAITPRRAGTFEIPAFTVNVDGRDVKTRPLPFVATKSETGDSLFVEIEGGKDKVFVGQPLDLKLKIWIKPFVDRERELKLSEANMWQMISDQTSWGSFSDRMQELADNNQRPGGEEVLRDDGQGNERSYYLYEIEATVYPKRPGKIDADDVQIVVNYPTALGKARDPFDDFFGGDSPFGGSPFGGRPFGGSSRLSRVMDDDFFGGSPFGNRLSVSSTRPIVGEAKVDATQVVAVPTAGRPADYRGAVGRYQIVTQATPTSVSAGDPITLNIGIVGTGPMELVQAPPLMELSSLTADFKVADQSLAGFVKDDTKVFPTTIRPRREGITEIPAIPFSFFDPDTEKFETVMSNPISISVEKSESLALDSIIGKSRSNRSEDSRLAASTRNQLEPEFTNSHSETLLVSESPATNFQWWWAFVVAPPLAWLAIVLFRSRRLITARLPRVGSPIKQCLHAIDKASDRSQIADALVRYISRRTRIDCSDTVCAVGALRKSGMYSIANDIESFFQSVEHAAFGGGTEQSPVEDQKTARALVERTEDAFVSMSKNQVRRKKQRSSGKRDSSIRDINKTAQRMSVLLLGLVLAFSASNALAAETASNVKPSAGTTSKVEIAATSNPSRQSLELTETQQRLILKEAESLYTRAMELKETDSAEANELFSKSAEKYRLLVDSGIRNSRLYMNLGNAFLQSGELGRAIANYERARKLDPSNHQLITNLEFANSLVKNKPENAETAADGATSLASFMQRLRSFNNQVVSTTSIRAITWTLVISSTLFWGILIVRSIGYRFPVLRFAFVPMLLLTVSLTSVLLTNSNHGEPSNAIIVANNLTLRFGDGEQFDEVYSLDSAQGHRVEMLVERGNWAKIKTVEGHTGWVPANTIEGT